MRRTDIKVKIFQKMMLMVTTIFFTLTSCTSNDLDDVTSSTDAIDVELSISSRASSTDPESQIKTLRVLAFEGNELSAQYVANPSQLNGTVHRFKMKLHLVDTRFYVIANEDAAGPLKINNNADFNFNQAVTPSDIESITFSALPSDIANKGVPMTAIHQVKVTKNTPITIDNLKRSVAKLTIYAIKKGSETGHAFINRGIYLYNEPQYGYLFAEKTPYKDTFTHKESTTGELSDGNNQKNGKVILSAEWKSDTDKNPVFGKIEINKTFTPGMQQEPGNFQQIQSIYLFANPNDDKINKGKENAYYLKFGWTRQYIDNNKKITDAPPTASVYLPVVNANDNLRFFAYISVTSTIINEFNWFVAPWIQAGGDIEFN